MEENLEFDAKYDFNKLATTVDPEDLMKSMSFNVDTSKLYSIESTCINNEANPYCPVQIKINDENLATQYGGDYLVQLWNNKQNLLFQRVRNKLVYSWNIINNIFIFMEDKDAINKMNSKNKTPREEYE